MSLSAFLTVVSLVPLCCVPESSRIYPVEVLQESERSIDSVHQEGPIPVQPDCRDWNRRIQAQSQFLDVSAAVH